MLEFRRPNWGIKFCSYLLSFGVAFYPLLLQANPQGGSVAAGEVHWEESGNRTNIIQESQQAVVNWESFNIDTAEHVDVQMPSQDSTHLSRVIGKDPSSILGKLTSNGNLFLVNPNGILFGKEAQVDVHGLVATTSSISNDDFLKGNYHFSKGPEKISSVVNEGRITAAEGGLVALVAPSVRNAGVIEARLGKVALASGETFTLDFYGDQLVEFGVSESVLENVKQEGTIEADGGTVLLAVQDATRVVDEVINMSGIIEANYAEEKNGEIILSGGSEGIVNLSGTLQAAGPKEGQRGGKISVLGDKVGLFRNALVDVSGQSGGGKILVGGNFQGKGPEQNSSKTHVAPGVQLHAESLQQGDAGRIIVWSDGNTHYFGKSFANGGPEGGDGGLVEVSGKENLSYLGKTFLAAPNGNAGTLLLDPANVTFSTDADSNTTGFTAGTDNTESFSEDSGQTSNFDVDAGGSFNGVGNNATIAMLVTSNITISSATNLSTASGNTGVNLTLRARNNVVLNAGITMDGSSTLIITADDDSSGAGAISGSGTLTMGTGDLQLSAATGIGTSDTNISTSGVTDISALTTSGGIYITNTGGSVFNPATVNSISGLAATSSGDISITNSASGGSITISQAITASGGNVTLTSGGNITDSAAITASGTASFTTTDANADITLDQGHAVTGAASFTTNGVSGNVTFDNGTTALNLGASTVRGNLTVTSGEAITDSGALTVTGTASFTTDVNDKDITLDTTTNAITGVVTFTTNGTGGDVTIDNGTTALRLGTSTINGNLTATSGEEITDAGALTVSGTASFTTDVADKDIILNTEANDITGAVSFTTNGTGGDVTIDNGTKALNLGASTINGNLTATSGGAITDSGALTVTGTASFTTDVANRSITLDTATNAMSGAVSTTTTGTGDFTLDNGTTALNLGRLSIGRNLSVTSGEAITDSGVITVGGTASFTTDVVGKAITLDSDNAITGAVSFSTSGSGADVVFDNGTTAISQGTWTLGHDLTLRTDTNQTISSPINLTGSTLTINIGGDSSLTVNAALTAADGITLTADDDILLNADGDLTARTGSISVTADNDSDRNENGGRITMAHGTVLDSGPGTQTLSADESITLGRLITTNTGNTAITLTSYTGGIVDGGDTGEWNIDAFSGRLVIDAASGVGAAGSKAGTAFDDAIEIRAGSIDIDNTRSGVIDLYEADDVTITNLKNNVSGKNVTLSFSSNGGGLPPGWENATANQGRVVLTNRNSGKRGSIIEESLLSVDHLSDTFELTAVNEVKNGVRFDSVENYVTKAFVDVCEWLDIACGQQGGIWH